MQFLNPFLLWGLGAASVPIMIHLLSRRRFQVQRWAAMTWLLAAAKRNKRRLQMQNLLLLLLRTLAVLFLALAITRPFFSDSPIVLASTQQAHLFLVVDNSASMGARSGLRTAFDDAVSNATALLGEIGDQDPVTLVVTNDNDKIESDRNTGRPSIPPGMKATRDHRKVRGFLSDLRPAAARASLVDVLKLLEDAVPEGGNLKKKVALLTDLQAVTIDGVSTREARSNDEAVRVALERLRSKGAEIVLIECGGDPTNVAVTGVRPEEDRDIVQGATVVFVADVANFSSRPQRVEVRFLLDGQERGDFSQWVELPPRPVGSQPAPRRTVRFVTTFADDADVGAHRIEARISSDGMPMDDARGFAFRVRPPIDVLVVDGDPRPEREEKERETYWLEPALALREGGPIAVTRVTEAEYRGLDDLSRFDMVTLANVRRPAHDDEAYERLREYVVGGGALFLTVGDRAVPSVWNEELYRGGGDEALLPARLLRAHHDPDLNLKLNLEANEHPILADITNPANSGFFQSPVLSGYMELDGVAAEKKSRVVTTYGDYKSPAMIEKRVGKGWTLLLTTTVDEDWGKLPGSYIFPALLHETVYHMTSRGNADRNLLTYQPYVRTFAENMDAFEIVYPDGSPALLSVERPADAPPYVTFGGTEQVGLYTTTLTYKPPDPVTQPPPPETTYFAVALSELESDVRRLRREEFDARWPELLEIADSFADAADEVRSGQTFLHRELLMLALLCLCGEMFVAQRIGRTRAQKA